MVWMGRFSRAKYGSSPMAVSMPLAMARCSISCRATTMMVDAQRRVASSCALVQVLSSNFLRVKAANRYCSMSWCSSSHASHSSARTLSRSADGSVCEVMNTGAEGWGGGGERPSARPTQSGRNVRDGRTRKMIPLPGERNPFSATESNVKGRTPFRLSARDRRDAEPFATPRRQLHFHPAARPRYTTAELTRPRRTPPRVPSSTSIQIRIVPWRLPSRARWC